MKLRAPKNVIVESSVAKDGLVALLRKNLPRASFQFVDGVPKSTVCSSSAVKDHASSVLEVVDFRGRHLKSCPGTRHYHCCGYRILHFGTQCSIGCSYCILQAYLNQPNLRLFGDLNAIIRELSEFLLQNKDRLHRIGTGEFTDSLLLDPYTEMSRMLVPYFAGTTNAVLELKTKTNHIRNLMGLDHGGRTIVAWSLNSKEVHKREEPFAATIRERLDAAVSCAKEGYYLAFHFDPIIDYPGWKSGYARTLDQLFAAIDPAQIVWISLGAFRFMPELKTVLRLRHPSSKIAYGEFIRGLDGKMRYFRDIRAEFYSFFFDRIRQADPDLCVYLCMESDDIWKDSLGFSPNDHGGLARMLDQAAEKRMGIGPVFGGGN